MFRAGLRLLVETAARDVFPDERKPLDAYLGEYGGEVKTSLRKKTTNNDLVTYFANNSVTPDTMCQLLNTGAHDYASSSSVDQARAISIFVGEMLRLSHSGN